MRPAFLRTALVAVAFFFSVSAAGATDHYDFTYPSRASLLAAGWDFNAVTASGGIRNTEQTTGVVVSYDQAAHPGVLRIPCDVGDLWAGLNNTRNTLFRDLPANWTSIRLKLSFAPTQNYQQAGLVAYQDDDNYVQVTRIFEGGNNVTFAREAQGAASIVKAVSQTATQGLILRMDRELATEKITGYYSLDGASWVSLGSVTQALAHPSLGIVVGASPGGLPNADILWAEIDSGGSVPGSSLFLGPDELVFNVIQGSATSTRQMVNVFQYGSNQLNWYETHNVSWLSVTPNSGQTPASLAVSVNASGLSAGVYSGTLTINATGTTPQSAKITLVVNPEGPITVSTWKDAHKGALSVSVDDGQTSCSSQLTANGFKGTYYYIGTSPPLSFANLYNAGMELGSHTTDHPCYEVDDDTLRYQEIEPNINGICAGTSQPCKFLISFAWPCGYTNFREEAVVSDYFLSARGYNHNQLEEPTPSDFMDLKSFNSHEHTPYPPADLKTVVDAAEQGGKWANLVFHTSCNDDNAISYAASKDVWVAPIGTVTKYILQRDRFILENYSKSSAGIGFTFHRLALAPSPDFDFETAFSLSDPITLKVDIDDSQTIGAVRLNGSAYQYTVLTINGNKFLLINTPILTTSQNVDITYQGGSQTPVIGVSPGSLQFSAVAGTNPASQTLVVSNAGGGTLSYTISDNSNWLSTSPSSGTSTGENDTITVSCNVTGLSVGTYTGTISIVASGANNSPQTVPVILAVNSSSSPSISRAPASLSTSATQGTNASSQSFQVSNAGGGTLSYTVSDDASWLSCSPVSGTSTGESDAITVSYSTAGLAVGTYTATISIAASGASNSPQTVNVTLTVNPVGTGAGHYDFTYPDRTSLLAAGWDFNAVTASGGIRNTEQTTGAVVSYDQAAHPGVLRIPCDVGDLWAGLNNTRNTLFRDLPANWTSIRLKLSFAPTQNYQQAGLVAYQDDDNYVQVTRIFEGGNNVTFAREAQGAASIVKAVSQTATQGLVLRLDREPATEKITGYYSLDGTNWVSLGSVTQTLSHPSLGIVVGASPGGYPNADIQWAEVVAP